MTAAALATLGPVATNAEGANMDAGLVAALAGARDAQLAALEVDEMHVPHVSDAVDAAGHRAAEPVAATSWTGSARSTTSNARCAPGWPGIPTPWSIANCDDVLMTSAAYDCPNVVWVAAGGGWANDSVSCPRSGELIVREGERLALDGHRLQAARAPSGGSTTNTSTAPTVWRCR